jgi:MFS family permease
MEIGKSLGDSFEYAKEAVWGKWVKWILFIVAMIFSPLMYGYMMEIYRGKRPSPDSDKYILTENEPPWGKLFIDGIKYFVATLIWLIPVIIVAALFFGLSFFTMMSYSSPTAMTGILATMAVGIILMIILAFIIGLFAIIGIIRMARTERFGEAFNFSAILAKIRAIGWGSYIISLIVLWIVIFIIAFILGIITIIPILGWVIFFIVWAPVNLFVARYLTLLYESGGEVVPVEKV